MQLFSTGWISRALGTKTFPKTMTPQVYKLRVLSGTQLLGVKFR